MITRIVRMHFRPEEVESFIDIYRKSRPFILEMKGCLGVSLHSQAGKPEIMFTISKWDSEEDLNHYRNSDFFKQTWTKTKALFESSADAWSLEEIS